MANLMIIPGGLRSKYTPLDREFFFDVDTQTLYIYWDKEWHPIGGVEKNIIIKAGTNLELISLENTQANIGTPDTLRLVDDVDVDTCELGKANKDTIPRWKGMVELGELENESFFPLFQMSDDYSNPAFMGGKLLLKATWSDGTVVYSQYYFSVASTGFASIKGGSESAVKAFICKATSSSNVHACLYVVDLTGAAPAKLQVWFNGWKNIPTALTVATKFSQANINSYTIISRESNGK